MNDDWYSDDTATFGDRVTAAREAAGLSPRDLARRIGVREGTVAAWEEDQADPRANKLQMLAGLLNVSLMWLLNGAGDGVAPPGEAAPLSADARALLAEMREVRGEIEAATQRLALLEGQFRHLLDGGAE